MLGWLKNQSKSSVIFLWIFFCRYKSFKINRLETFIFYGFRFPLFQSRPTVSGTEIGRAWKKLEKVKIFCWIFRNVFSNFKFKAAEALKYFFFWDFKILSIKILQWNNNKFNGICILTYKTDVVLLTVSKRKYLYQRIYSKFSILWNIQNEQFLF